MALTITPAVTSLGTTISDTTGGQILLQANSSGTTLTKSGNTLTFGISAVPNSSLANSTISGIALGSNLNTLTLGSYLTGTSYNGSGAVTAAVDATSANTASKVVARDGSGNFSAGTITASLTGNVTGNVTGSSGSCTGNAATATTAGSITGQANSATITATSANTANQIVLRDNSGNFSCGVMTGTATAARYSDLAENYVADSAYEPGTVLMIGGDYEVTLALNETTRLAGVISTAPAHLMNSDCAGEHVVAIALQGRVPCKIRGSALKGDMLISAGDGYAKSVGTNEPKLGQVIGKALENFNGDEGVIEVMVGRL